MRVVGALVCVISAALAAVAVRRAFGAPRPRDLAWATLAPLAIVGFAVGGLLLFVPDFF